MSGFAPESCRVQTVQETAVRRTAYDGSNFRKASRSSSRVIAYAMVVVVACITLAPSRHTASTVGSAAFVGPPLQGSKRTAETRFGMAGKTDCVMCQMTRSARGGDSADAAGDDSMSSTERMMMHVVNLGSFIFWALFMEMIISNYYAKFYPPALPLMGLSGDMGNIV